MELKRDHPNIKVTTILPASINTPFFDHARSRMGVRPRPMPPVYEPRDVALAIVAAAETPQRDVYVGSAAKTLATLNAFSPALTDRLMLAGEMAFASQRDDDTPVEQTGILDEPSVGPGRSRGDWGGQTHPSLYTRAFEIQNPNAKRLLTLALGVGAAALVRRSLGGDGQTRRREQDDRLPAETYAPFWPEYIEPGSQRPDTPPLEVEYAWAYIEQPRW